jgi:hypothetical protein
VGDLYVNCTLTEVFLNLTEVFLTLAEVFLTLAEVFPCFYLSCKANARIKLAKTGHGPHSTTFYSIFVLFGCYYLCCSVVICVVLTDNCVRGQVSMLTE